MIKLIEVDIMIMIMINIIQKKIIQTKTNFPFQFMPKFIIKRIKKEAHQVQALNELD